MNILEAANYGIEKKTFGNGLWYFSQPHCQISITDDGFRIYRTPNLTQGNNGNVMYGGLVLKPLEVNSMALSKNHSYIITLNIKGKTSGAMNNVYLSNNAGWGGGGLSPSPQYTEIYNPVTANFSSSTWNTFYYKFTINDDVYKICTSSYSSFVSGTTYPSYRDFFMGFTYADTGTMGTELYVKNVRMYDITNLLGKIDVMSVGKNGVMDYLTFIENLNDNDNAQIYRFGEVRGRQFYEI